MIFCNHCGSANLRKTKTIIIGLIEKQSKTLLSYNNSGASNNPKKIVFSSYNQSKQNSQ